MDDSRTVSTAAHPDELPTTDHVRFIYSLDGADYVEPDYREYKAQEFDHWYAAEIAAAEQRGAERAFNEAANEVRREMRWQYEQNINRNSDPGDSIDRLLELEKVFKYHADQMEGGRPLPRRNL